MPRRSDRILILGLDGATFSVLTPLADSGVMPNLATLLRTASLWELESTQPCITPAAWTSLQTGADPQRHGIWDFRRLTGRPARLELNDSRHIRLPTLFEHVEAAGGRVVSLGLPVTWPSRCASGSFVVGGIEAPHAAAALDAAPRLRDRLRAEGLDLPLDVVWHRRPRSWDEHAGCVAATARDFLGRAKAARLADELVDWGVMFVQFQALDALQHRAWHLLGIEEDGSAPSPWARKTHEAYRALDDAVGELIELAERRRATVMIASDHGFGAFRGKISLANLLERRGLTVRSQGAAKVGYRAARWLWKAGRLAPWNSGVRAVHRTRPLTALLPIDWRRSRVIAAHGNLAALFYLNTPQRFGRGPVDTLARYSQAAAEAIAALDEARHPETGERLFVDCYSTRDRFGLDPVACGMPDVVGIPADGFHTRYKFGGDKRLVLADSELTGTHRREGVWVVAGLGAAPGLRQTAALRDVAPTVLDLMGLAPPATMTGRSQAARFGVRPRPAPRAPAAPRRSAPAPRITAYEQAAVEDRLRRLGYLD